MQEELPFEEEEGVLTQIEFQFESAKLIVAFPTVVCNSNKFLKANLTIIPKIGLLNSPLEVELRGCSSLQNLSSIQSKKQSQLEITQSCLNEKQDKMQANFIMGESKHTERKKENELTGGGGGATEHLLEDGQYFLQGCLVLFQLDEEKEERLEALLPDKVYKYPVEFILPPCLPVSLSSVLLKNIHISIKYTLEIKLTLCRTEGRKTQLQTVVLPFEMQEEGKIYPYQELVLTQQIRLYHHGGKKQDELLKSNLTKFVRCFCPPCLFNLYVQKNQLLSTQYQTYDLYYLQLLTVVNRDHSIFFTVRAYKEPEQEQLTMNREKKPKETAAKQGLVIKEVKSMSEMPQDISLVSIKQTDRKPTGLTVQYVQLKMWGEISNVCKQVIFTKTIYLTHCNYDMVEGQCIVQLCDYLQYPKSCHNELFNFTYSFTMNAFFNQEEEQEEKHSEMFVVEEKITELIL